MKFYRELLVMLHSKFCCPVKVASHWRNWSLVDYKIKMILYFLKYWNLPEDGIEQNHLFRPRFSFLAVSFWESMQFITPEIRSVGGGVEDAVWKSEWNSDR